MPAVRQIADCVRIVSREYALCKADFFGSCADGTNMQHSDVHLVDPSAEGFSAYHQHLEAPNGRTSGTGCGHRPQPAA